MPVEVVRHVATRHPRLLSRMRFNELQPTVPFLKSSLGLTKPQLDKVRTHE